MAGPKQFQNLDVSNRRINSTNVPLEVALLDASGNQVVSFGGGTQYTEGDQDATIIGTALLFEGDSTNNTLNVPNSTKGLPVNIVGGSAAGTEYTDANSTISGPNQTFRDSSGAVRGVASTRGYPVAIVAGSAAGTEYTDADSTISGANLTFRDSSGAVRGVASTRALPVAASTTVQVSSVAGAVIMRSTAAEALVTVYQSTAADLNVTVAGYVAPSTTVQVSSVAGAVIVRSTAAELKASVYQSTAADLNVTVAGYSTTVNVSSLAGAVIVRSTAADFLASVYQSTAADLNVTVAGYSTTANVSSLAGRVRAQNSTIGDFLASVQQNSTVWAVQIPTSQSIQVKNSTIGDLLASVQQNSTVWQTQAKIQDSSGVSPNIVGIRPTTGAQGMAVRTVLNDLQSTCFSTIGNGSTSSTVVSSVAALRHKVFAYSITSTNQAVNTLTFASSLANPLWHVALQSFSSGVSGANLSVTPPAWLFATEAASPLVFKVTGTTGSYHLSFSYFSEA